MDPDSARHLCESRNRFFNVLPVEHHQVGEFVEDDDDVWKRLVLAVLVKQTRRVFCKELVVLIDVADALLGQQLQATLHLTHGVAQRDGSKLRLSNDRRVKMWNAIVVSEFDSLGIHENQTHLIGSGLEQQ